MYAMLLISQRFSVTPEQCKTVMYLRGTALAAEVDGLSGAN